MGVRRNRQSGKQGSLLHLCVLLVLLFLAHDTLMAAEVLAAPAGHANASHHAAHAGAGMESAAFENAASPAGHPGACGIGTVAVPRSGVGNPFEQALPLAAYATPPTLTLAAPHSIDAWQEPQWPAGTRRALWQVYRI